MGLSVEVGLLAELMEEDPEGAEWLRESFAAVNKVLARENLPLHHEPETLPPMSNRCPLSGYPYSFLHYLRRAYACRKADKAWVAHALPPSEEPTDDPDLRAEYARGESHLLMHSDAEGFYVPVDFESVLYDQGEGVPGEAIGSSYRLLDELLFVAPAIGIFPDGRNLSDEQANEIAALTDKDELHIEKLVWLSLFEAARLSIEHGTAICFA